MLTPGLPCHLRSGLHHVALVRRQGAPLVAVRRSLEREAAVAWNAKPSKSRQGFLSAFQIPDAQKRDPQIWKAPSLTFVYANMLLDCWGSAEKKIACATKKEERRRTINSKERNLPVSTIKFLPIRLVRLDRIKQVLAFSCAARSRRPPTRTLCLEPQQRHQGSSSGGETRSSSASAVGGGAGLP